MQQVKLDEVQWHDRFTYKKVVPFDLGYSKFQVIRFEAGNFIGNHFHEITKEVFLVLKGEGVLKINDVPYPLSVGYTYLIEPGDVHAIEATTDLEIAIFKPTEGGDEDIYWETYENA